MEILFIQDKQIAIYVKLFLFNLDHKTYYIYPRILQSFGEALRRQLIVMCSR